MEIQFEQRPVRFLCRTAWGEKTVEETAEIKLPNQEALPEEILSVWGQPCLTEKHWAEGAASVSGGVNTWVLLRTSDGVQCVAGWVPFRQSWELHDSQRDGKVVIRSHLKGVDARMTGAGKLIITAQISLHMQALEPCTVNRYMPPQLPDDLYVQQNNLSVVVPVESGEKRVALEETVLPGQTISNVLYHRTQPETEECRIMADKLIFRGKVHVHALCQGEDGDIFAVQESFPVSQYIQLDGEYGSKSTGDVIPVVLSSEAEKDENGHIAFCINVLWQYVLYDEVDVDVTSDAYSNRRAVKADMTQVYIPTLLEKAFYQQEAVCTFAPENGETVDCAVMTSCADWDDRSGKLMQSGSVRVLYRDGEQQLRSALLPFEMESLLEQGENGFALSVDQKPADVQQDAQGGIHVRIQCDMHYMFDRQIPCCKGLTMADEYNVKEARPCYILRRAGSEDLWQLAKACGSSEAMIRLANGLEGYPEKEKMLIIPVE